MAFRGFVPRFLFGGSLATAACGLRRALNPLAKATCDNNSTQEVAPAATVPALAGRSDVDLESHPSHVAYEWKKKVSGLSYKYQTMKCVDIVEVAPDVKIFRFALPERDARFELPPCSTVQCKIKLGPMADQYVERFYTPCTPNGATGHFDLIVRNHYGKFTTPLFKLKVGDVMDFRAVMFKLKYKANKWQEIGMIAGGSGITPMLQVIRQALPLGTEDPYYELIKGMKTNEFTQKLNDKIDPEQSNDKTKISLLFANRNEKSVFLKEYLDKLAELRPERFRVNYVVDSVEKGSDWKGFVGHINKDMVASTMPKPKKGKTMTLLCGPDGMITHLCGGGSAVMGAMHMGSFNNGGLKSQGGGADYVNNIPIEGLMAELGYDMDTVYRF